MDAKKLPEELRNKIFSWRGGGYDGCIWEPNLAFSEEDGTYRPVISTGFDGIKDAETLLSVLDEMKEKENGEKEYFSRGPMRVLEADQDGVDLLCKTVRNDYVAQLVDDLNDTRVLQLEMTCRHCRKRFTSLGYSFMDLVRISYDAGRYRGDGGIGVVVDGVLCDDCRYELIEKIRAGDWIYVCGCEKTRLGLKENRHEVLRVTDDGDFVVEEDGREITVESEYCEKEW